MAPILEQIVIDVMCLFGSAFVYTETKDGYGNVVSTDKNKTYQLFVNVGTAMANTLTEIFNKTTNKEDQIFVAKLKLKLVDFFIYGDSHMGSILTWYDHAIELSDTLKKLDPSFTSKDYREAKAKLEKASMGCVITFGVLLAIGLVALVIWLIAK